MCMCTQNSLLVVELELQRVSVASDLVDLPNLFKKAVCNCLFDTLVPIKNWMEKKCMIVIIYPNVVAS